MTGEELSRGKGNSFASLYAREPTPEVLMIRKAALVNGLIARGAELELKGGTSNLEMAVDAYHAAVNRDSDSEDARSILWAGLHKLKEAYLEDGKPVEDIRYIDNTIRHLERWYTLLSSDSPFAKRGYELEITGNPNAASRLYLGAVRKDPSDSAARKCLYEILIEIGCKEWIALIDEKIPPVAKPKKKGKAVGRLLTEQAS